MATSIIQNEDLYKKVILPIANARKFVWIGTADIKDMHVRHNNSVKSFLAVLNDLVNRNVAVRLLHAKDPGPNFRNSFDKYPKLWDGIERQLCPRVHFKIIVIDGKMAYTGSANLTGAGLGMKSPNRRNFESGIISTDPPFVDTIMQQFDDVWRGDFCKSCGRKDYCSDPIV